MPLPAIVWGAMLLGGAVAGIAAATNAGKERRQKFIDAIREFNALPDSEKPSHRDRLAREFNVSQIDIDKAAADMKAGKLTI